MKKYVFEIEYKNGLSGIEKVYADSRDDAINQLKMRGDIARYTYVRVE